MIKWCIGCCATLRCPALGAEVCRLLVQPVQPDELQQKTCTIAAVGMSFVTCILCLHICFAKIPAMPIMRTASQSSLHGKRWLQDICSTKDVHLLGNRVLKTQDKMHDLQYPGGAAKS